MATPVEMPQLGTSVEECVLTRWLKREGDVIAAGDPIAEIETDKTTFEVSAPVAGTLLARFFDEGALVPVFTNLFVIGAPGESTESFRPAAGGATRAAAATSGGPVAPTSANSPSVVREATTRRAIAFSPRASRFAAAHNFYPASIAGSGPGGRVLEHDLRRAFEAGASPQSRPEPVAAPPLPDHGPVTGLRATIARRMRESLASTAQYTLNGSADATGLVSLRARVKTRMADGLRDITIGDLVAFCTVQALLDAPGLNAEYIDGRIVQHAHVHLAFAVDTPRGLLAPVVRNAQDLSVVELSAQLKALAESAVTGAIQPDDLSGATFTVSNLGSLGIESFTPLINPPQVAILGVGTIQPRVVRRTGPRDVVRIRETSARRAMALAGSVEFVDSLGLSLTCDHQVVDGVPGARFLQVVRRKIESVESLVEI